jgi:hypothetical protein
MGFIIDPCVDDVCDYAHWANLLSRLNIAASARKYPYRVGFLPMREGQFDVT